MRLWLTYGRFQLQLCFVIETTGRYVHYNYHDLTIMINLNLRDLLWHTAFISSMTERLVPSCAYVLKPLQSRLALLKRSPPQVLMLASTFAALLLALTTAALPHVVVDKSPISLSLSRHLNSTGSVKSLAEIDRARAQALRLKTGPGPKISKRGVFPVTLTSNAVSYSVDVSWNVYRSLMRHRLRCWL